MMQKEVLNLKIRNHLTKDHLELSARSAIKATGFFSNERGEALISEIIRVWDWEKNEYEMAESLCAAIDWLRIDGEATELMAYFRHYVYKEIKELIIMNEINENT
ncbi:TPA: hypothetical protein ACPVZG_000326 [Vibrio parahaemolyticus]